MPDMLVKLYELPSNRDLLAKLQTQNITIRRAMALEKNLVCDWVREHFNPMWISETDVTFSRNPITCFLALRDQELLGFSSYDVSARGFFGPTGVQPSARGLGLGKALLIAALQDMRCQNYGYAIIGSVGPAEFYQKAVNAVIIPDSSPGIYKGRLNYPPQEK
jgi:GNAT superfamily N-acetyltransferase